MNSILTLNKEFYNNRHTLESRLIMLMYLLNMNPDRNCINSKTDSQLTSMYNLCLRQFTTMKKYWPEMYTSMVFRMALGREPSADENRVWVFGLALRRIDQHLESFFGSSVEND